MNRLGEETSPYLLQHRNNPVDWYPWSEEAFQRARDLDQPVFLSIGYATCHWCHVMEHESFEDEAVASLLNDSFISIKVDREERPDIDQVYMTVCQLMGGSCGWPLTVIMTPSRKPFFVATYIPKSSRFGRVGMVELLPRISALWRDERERVEESAGQITSALRSIDESVTGPRTLDSAWLKLAFEQFAERYDSEHGGFGASPKFPAPHNLLFLLRYAHRTGDARALEMVAHTLRSMRSGGIFDQIGFGFHRYSTDGEWRLPHFEKMLYDQALHIMAYTEAYLATGDHFFADVAREVADYVLRDMTAPAGGFYSAEDADSEGVEGKFYVWTVDEVVDVLSADLADLVIETYGLEPAGNFLDEATRELTGENVLHGSLDESGDGADRADRLDAARALLFAHREQRERPLLDDKVLTDWNGLMIAALSKLGSAVGDDRYVVAAKRAASFVSDTLYDDRGHLQHRYRDGVAGIDGHLTDYACMIWGLIELYQATYEPGPLGSAISLAEQMIERFWDDTNSGFFMTPVDGEELVARLKDLDDGALPSGNAIALLCFLRLSRLTADARFEEFAARLLAAVAPRVRRYPSGYAGMLIGLEFIEGGATEVVVAGSAESPDVREMIGELRRRYLPNTVSLCVGTDWDDLQRIAPFAGSFQSAPAGALAYVCRDHVCAAPSASAAEMVAELQAQREDLIKPKRSVAPDG
ncbi:MAG: thioredoxin domain-containing protein [Rhodothermales bacterium]|nr:thioredoxin domain-containing protein [Rhodothermales bacterium]